MMSLESSSTRIWQHRLDDRVMLDKECIYPHNVAAVQYVTGRKNTQRHAAARYYNTFDAGGDTELPKADARRHCASQGACCA